MGFLSVNLSRVRPPCRWLDCVGFRANGVIGGLLSYIGFGLPAFALMLILSVAYVNAQNELPFAVSLFKGLQVIVVAIIANATYSFGKGIFKDYREMLIALISAALLWLAVSPFVVIIGAALAGTLLFMKLGSPALPTHTGKRNQSEFKQLMLLFLSSFSQDLPYFTLQIQNFLNWPPSCSK